MTQRNNESQKSNLALAIAAGNTVKGWADENGVARRTAYTWAQSPEVRKLVERIRRRAMDRAIGRLSQNATAAATKIAKLVKDATSEAVMLNAARAVLADLMSVSNYAGLDRRLAKIERRMRDSGRQDQTRRSRRATRNQQPKGG